MARFYERLRSQILCRELENIGLENTPQCDLYDDETENEQLFPQLAEELDPMLQVGGYNIGAARGHSGNVMAEPMQILSWILVRITWCLLETMLQS